MPDILTKPKNYTWEELIDLFPLRIYDTTAKILIPKLKDMVTEKLPKLPDEHLDFE